MASINVEEVLSKLTIQEKVSLLSGKLLMTFHMDAKAID